MTDRPSTLAEQLNELGEAMRAFGRSIEDKLLAPLANWISRKLER